MAKKGLCAICGKGGKLTEEHVPPQCAGNLRGVNLHTFADWLKADGDPDNLPNAQPRPSGTLWVTLCERCNNEVLGGWYVPDFCHFVQATARALGARGKDQLDALRRAPEPWVRVRGEAAGRPLSIVKVVAGMILAVNAEDDPGFRARHAPLAEFVLDRDSPLPPPYRAYLAVHLGDYAAFAPTMFRVDATGTTVAFSAIDYPPLAYILTFNEPNPDAHPFLPCGGLATYGQLPYDRKGRIEIDLLVSGRDLPVPGSYGPLRAASTVESNDID